VKKRTPQIHIRQSSKYSMSVMRPDIGAAILVVPLLSISAHAVWFYFVYGDVPKLFGFLGGPFMVTVHVSQLDNCRNRLSTLFCRNIRQFSQIPAGKEGFHAGLLIFF